MPADHSYVAQNREQRHRLSALVTRLTDRQLATAMDAGWTVAAVLAHVAFWDQRILVLLDAWERAGASAVPKPLDHAAVDWINDSAKALALALPPRAAAELAVHLAERVDAKLEGLDDTWLAANAAAGHPLNTLRATHRREHLDAIERAVGGAR